MITVSVFLLLLLLYLVSQKISGDYPELPKSTSVRKVIDVSKWEGKIDWKKVKNSGIHHAILKIGSGDHDGTGFNEDPLFITNYENAIQKGINCGVYFFSYAVTKEEAQKEALYCLDLLKKYKINPKDLALPVAFDIEYDKALKTGRRNCTDMTVAFCETIKDAGYDPMVYSSASYFEDKLIYKEIKDYKLWVANYEATGPDFSKPYAMWQYSEDGIVDGVKDLCDMNYWYSDYIEVSKITVADTRITMDEGKTKTITAAILPKQATNKRLNWTSSNERVVTILDSQTGEVKAVGKGTTWLTVRTPSGVKERVRVRVQ